MTMPGLGSRRRGIGQRFAAVRYRVSRRPAPPDAQVRDAATVRLASGRRRGAGSLIGALKNAGSFGRRSALKTWVFAILKNKIADTLRRKQRLVDASSLLREGEEEEDFSALFDTKGHWHMDDRPPATWASPPNITARRPVLAGIRGMPGEPPRQSGPRIHDA